MGGNVCFGAGMCEGMSVRGYFGVSRCLNVLQGGVTG